MMSLTWSEYVEICQACKARKRKNPDQPDVQCSLAERFNVTRDDHFKQSMSTLQTRYWYVCVLLKTVSYIKT